MLTELQAIVSDASSVLAVMDHPFFYHYIFLKKIKGDDIQSSLYIKKRDGPNFCVCAFLKGLDVFRIFFSLIFFL
jgi:hypothetical protein